MSIFGATAIHQEMTGVDLSGVLKADGEQAVSYAVFQKFPFSQAVIIFYMISAFVCFVTSSDSNMSAMASISSAGISPENPEGNPLLKIAWGVAVGTVAWVMISFTGGTDGIRILSNLGGFPAAILELFIIAGLVKVVLFHQRMSVVD